jgi:hypothetical protein
MLQELREAVRVASELVSETASRLRQGDPAPELLERLASRVADIERLVPRAGALPEDLRADIAKLLSDFDLAVRGGDDWLTNVGGTEIASQQVTDRLRQAYGLSPSRHSEDFT